MGQEIEHTDFKKRDFAHFAERLKAETELLAQWIESGEFEDQELVAGFEAEGWLVDANFRPAPVNKQFLEQLAHPLVVPELASFNVEINSTPRAVSATVLEQLRQEFTEVRSQCRKCAATIGAQFLMIGTLPTLEESDLTIANMSGMRRFRALNEQVLRSRSGKPLRLDIQGRDHLRTTHHDVMVEAATTSFQIHLQVPVHQAARFYNAAQIISGPMVALAANSPYLFGKQLWEETRIPLFEQAVDVGGPHAPKRVGFGRRYFRNIMECFRDNLDNFQPLLPLEMSGPIEGLDHLRLHNGTIWRWNRPLIGVEGGRPHLRIEHRVLPSGPSETDSVANAALFLGLTYHLATSAAAPEERIDFAKVKANFYAACRRGLAARFSWFDGEEGPAVQLLVDKLLPIARAGLEQMNLDQGDIDNYMGVIAARLHSQQTGSAWQRNYISRNGGDMATMVAAYAARQTTGAPVHEWQV